MAAGVGNGLIARAASPETCPKINDLTLLAAGTVKCQAHG